MKSLVRPSPGLTGVQQTLDWERAGLMAGVDEAGRGPLAGPVMAAAVILNPKEPIEGLDDSKKLTARKRQYLYEQIMAKALCCSVAQASVEEIDELNILQATLLAMRRAVMGLRLTPTRVLIDGNQVPVLPMLVEAVVRGDALIPAISAASILAKVSRDRWCDEMHCIYPDYGFSRHKGYGTAQHMTALRLYGATPVHRRSFSPVRAHLCPSARLVDVAIA